MPWLSVTVEEGDVTYKLVLNTWLVVSNSGHPCAEQSLCHTLGPVPHACSPVITPVFTSQSKRCCHCPVDSLYVLPFGLQRRGVLAPGSELTHGAAPLQPILSSRKDGRSWGSGVTDASEDGEVGRWAEDILHKCLPFCTAPSLAEPSLVPF